MICEICQSPCPLKDLLSRSEVIQDYPQHLLELAPYSQCPDFFHCVEKAEEKYLSLSIEHHLYPKENGRSLSSFAEINELIKNTIKQPSLRAALRASLSERIKLPKVLNEEQSLIYQSKVNRIMKKHKIRELTPKGELFLDCLENCITLWEETNPQ